MKKTYKKLDSELLLVETEGGFMGASIRLNTSVEVAPYENYTDWLDQSDLGVTAKPTDGSFNVTFD